MAAALPTEARVVIVGGGIIGCSIAYHLAKMGWQDVVLLERKKLTSGTTWHAAGLVGQLRPSQNMTKLAKYTCRLRWTDAHGKLLAQQRAAVGGAVRGQQTRAEEQAQLSGLRHTAPVTDAPHAPQESGCGAIIAFADMCSRPLDQCVDLRGGAGARGR